MMARGTRPDKGARGTARHVPVLLPQVLNALAPHAGGHFIDATFGAGGYTKSILAAAADVRVLAIDRDPRAIAQGETLVRDAGGRLTLVEGRFSDLDRMAEEHGFKPADGIVFDVGVSSMQLDEAERGFSFQSDGPLDMRMSARGTTAADVLNTADEAEIADILFHLGEERSARLIARRIVARRQDAPLTRTGELAELVARALGRDKIGGRHAATRTFQALRIYVNEEIAELAAGLAAAERLLKPGGRLAVVSFHSLEDRLVKRFLHNRAIPKSEGSRHLPPRGSLGPPPSFRFINQRPVSPTQEEIAGNPRARSAKLRAAIRTDAPAWPEVPSVSRSRGITGLA
jgi:16S rRNA (cytosine1402-N4)-methyltransferase